MCNSKSYYEYALELASENQKVNELIMTPKFAACLEEVTQEQVSTYESNSLKSVKEFINTILNNTSKQIDLIESKEFILDMELISLCEQKIKSMTYEDTKEFNMSNIYLKESIENMIDLISENTHAIDEDIEEFCKGNLHDY